MSDTKTVIQGELKEVERRLMERINAQAGRSDGLAARINNEVEAGLERDRKQSRRINVLEDRLDDTQAELDELKAKYKTEVQRAEWLQDENVRLRKQLDDEPTEGEARATIKAQAEQINEQGITIKRLEADLTAERELRDRAITRANELSSRLFHARRALNADNDPDQLDREYYGANKGQA